VATVVLVVDVTSKMLAVDQLAGRHPIEIVDGLLSLRLVRNAGAAFGLAEGMTVILTCIAFVVIGLILRASRRLRNTSWAVALGLVLGGALGNLGDRLFRSPGPFRGHVIDFLELPHWPVFNAADMAIMCGAGLLVLLSLRGVQHDGPSRSRAETGSSPEVRGE
jgi:signal peptidase II